MFKVTDGMVVNMEIGFNIFFVDTKEKPKVLFVCLFLVYSGCLSPEMSGQVIYMDIMKQKHTSIGLPVYVGQESVNCWCLLQFWPKRRERVEDFWAEGF